AKDVVISREVSSVHPPQFCYGGRVECRVTGGSACHGARALFTRHWSLVTRHILWSLALGAWRFSLPAQLTTTAPPPDPLMSLMLSQPRIEIGAPVSAVAWFDPPVVAPGQFSFYRVTFNALEESIDWPAELRAPPKLEL